MDIVERLHPCPFCGAEPVVKDLAGWEVYCTNCGASGPTVFPGTANETTLRVDAVSTWNASNREIERLRDENAKLRADAERLMAAVEELQRVVATQSALRREALAREAKLRHEVGLCYRMLLSEPDTQGALFKAENLLREALALPQDDTALREIGTATNFAHD